MKTFLRPGDYAVISIDNPRLIRIVATPTQHEYIQYIQIMYGNSLRILAFELVDQFQNIHCSPDCVLKKEDAEHIRNEWGFRSVVYLNSNVYACNT